MQSIRNEKSPAVAAAGAQSAALQAIADLLDAISIAESKPSHGPAIPLPRALVENVVEAAIVWLDAIDGDPDDQDGNFLEMNQPPYLPKCPALALAALRPMMTATH